MKRKLLLLLSLLVSLSIFAQTGLKGVVIDSKTGMPIAGATVILDEQGVSATTGPDGDFLLTGAVAGKDVLVVNIYCNLHIILHSYF